MGTQECEIFPATCKSALTQPLKNYAICHLTENGDTQASAPVRFALTQWHQTLTRQHIYSNPHPECPAQRGQLPAACKLLGLLTHYLTHFLRGVKKESKPFCHHGPKV